MKIKECIPYLIAFIALFVGVFYDYQITDALHESVPFVGLVFERIVLIPIEGVVMFTMCLLYRKYHKLWILILAYAGAWYVIQDSLHYWMNVKTPLMVGIILVASLLLVVLCVYILRKVSDDWVNRHINFFVFYTAVLLSAVILTSCIKHFWGRIRYRDIEELSQFCVWYKPCGLIGNRSFPSGHITAMTTILCVLQWKQHHFEKVSILRYVFVGAMILIMGVSRMIMGAHFLSDLAAGFLITYTCYLVIRNLFIRRGKL
ncbi:phosphatase PAP2 family protein [Amedibacillus sp. YH-ame6]